MGFTTMKKMYINKEFEFLSRFYGNTSRIAVKNYAYNLYEKLGSIDYKKSFALYCSKKRVEIFQPTKETAIGQYNEIKKIAKKADYAGAFYYFGKDQENAVILEDAKPLLVAYRNYIKEYCTSNAA